MFGFSIQKLLFTGLAIAAVWYAFKWLGRVQAEKTKVAREQARKMKDSGGSGPAARNAEPGVEDMVECPHCGAFVPADGSHRCDKLDQS
jgi:hypothetical protein|tara:strand:+ start:109 stop:375 length:267 start_codon:yes stop_codon:yes gene_type:complete